MREIKFRAYYQKVTDDSWVIEGEYTLKDLTDRGIQFDQERIKWVEWTGLKDRDGEEIYEGDVVEFVNPDTGERTQSEVFFDCGGFSIEVYPHYCPFMGELFDYKIIGNIYQTPELLK